MGMFDSVIGRCPKCKIHVEFQSKAGPCNLYNYDIESVPPEIAIDVDGDMVICKCGGKLTINKTNPIQRIQMFITVGE